MTQKDFEGLSITDKAAYIDLIKKKSVIEEWEAALLISRSLTALRELRYKHKIPFVQDGRTIKYRIIDLDAYHEKKLVPALI